MSRILKFVTGIFLCGLILIGGRANAAALDAMQIFRETVMETAKSDSRIFHQNIFFVVPTAMSELDFICGIENNRLSLAGNFGFWMIDASGAPTVMEVPFYVAQNADNLTIYFQTDKKWKKMTSPIQADQFKNIFNVNPQAIEMKINLTREVSILKETDSQRILRVKIDGNKIADIVKAELMNVKNGADAIQSPIFASLDTGIRNADIWYTWSVDKNTWETATVSANLSGLVQAVAQAVLNNDSAQQIPDTFREMLETVAFYSEFKTYTTYLNADAKSRLEIPKKVLKAKEVESFSDANSKSKKK